MRKDDTQDRSIGFAGWLGSALQQGLPAAIREGLDDLKNRLAVPDGSPLAGAASAQELEAEQRQWHQLGDPPVMQPRLRPGTRLLAGAGGFLLFALKPMRGTRMIGAGLLISALANRPLWQALGLGAGRRVVDLSKTLVVAAPIDAVFEFWKNFQNFELFMQHVSEVKVLDETRSHRKVAGPVGIPVEWDAVLTVCIPKERLGWKTLPDQPVEHAGTVHFEALPEGGTRINLKMSYKPPAGIIGHAVAALFQVDPETALDHDLLRFKKIIESQRPVPDRGA